MHLPDPRERVAQADATSEFHVLTAVSVVLLLLTIGWSVVDMRDLEGTAVWLKPMKFSLSFVVLFATLAVVAHRLSSAVQKGWTLRIVIWVMAAAFLSEMAYIIYQAARAEPSHFNFSTPFNRFMYEVVMAAGAVALVLAVGVIGWLVKRDPTARLGDGLREGIVVGFGLTLILTLVTAGYLSAMSGPIVGEHPPGAPTLPLFGWSGVTGDLRPAHFLALHAMQVLPLLGFVLDRRGVRAPAKAVRRGAIGYVGITLVVFGVAIAGLPIIPLA